MAQTINKNAYFHENIWSASADSTGLTSETRDCNHATDKFHVDVMGLSSALFLP
jgi:hypothetical protein